MIYMNVILTAKDAGDVPRLQELLQTHAGNSRAEPGCERFELYHSGSDERVFILSEHWASESAYAAHREAESAKTLYLPVILPLVERIAHPCTRLSPAA